MVCDKLYNIFKDVFKCETRISVEYTFQKRLATNKFEKQVEWLEERVDIGHRREKPFH